MKQVVFRRLGLLVALVVALPLAVGSEAAQSAGQALPAFSSVAAAGADTCAVTAGGGAMCWGQNNWGQLGDGVAAAGSTVPVDVVGLRSGVVAVAAGGGHTCALTGAGGVKCWGWNAFGQLGDGTTTDRGTPVDVVGLGSGVVAINAGGAHTCALTSAGGVKCWGDNGSGRLGDGTTVSRSTPVDVVGLGSGVVAISAGDWHTCAVTEAGAAKCWGPNSSGELGDGSTTDRATPVDVRGLTSGVLAISAGTGQTCALTSAGAAKCWGYNEFGQLGDGTTDDRHLPVQVAGLATGVAAISAGYFHTCARTSAGGAKCWGFNFSGQLGDGTTIERHSPVSVVGLASGVVAIDGAGLDHTCAVTTGGTVKCWGGNRYGELGDGTVTGRSTPADVTDRAMLASVAVSVDLRVNVGVPFTVQAEALDALNHPITTYGGSGSWTSLDGALRPAAPADFVDGVSTTSATVGVPFRTDRITVTMMGVSGGSGYFDVLGPFARVAVGVAGPVKAGVPFTVTARATDAAGNLVSDYYGSATWSSLDGVLSPAAPNNFVNGVSTTTATVSKVYPADRITVHSGGVAGTSASFDVGGLTSISVTVGVPVSAGSLFTVTAVARDGAGKTLSGYNAAATWSSLDGAVSPTAPSTFVNGVSTTSAKIGVPFKDDRITVASGGVSGQSGPFNVLGPLASFSFKMQGLVSVSTPTAGASLATGVGSPFQVKATARDTVGNALASYSGSASWSSLDGTLAPATPNAFANGVSSTTATISVPYRGDRITISSDGVTSQSGLFTVVGPLATILVRVATPVTHGAPFTVKATATDTLGTPLPNYNATATWSSLDGHLAPATPTAFVKGLSTTTATIPSVFANDRITVTSGGISGKSGLFTVH